MLAELIHGLRNELQTRRTGYVQRFDNLIGLIDIKNDANAIGQLLPLFDDEAKYEEAMFSIVHAIEQRADPLYVREVIEHLHSFFRRSPKWAIIIFIRILNSQKTMIALNDEFSC